ncbi:MAG: acetyl-CoA hydrolase/transferase family protein [Phycisphaerales bacterium]|nr:acetyl-CoA hydrolase/transferase family protein [Phycisphaerales bacterium]
MSPSSSTTRRHSPRIATSADEAVAPIRSGMNVFVHGACMTSTPLLEALARRTDLENVRLYHLHLAGPLPHLDAPPGRFRSISLFTGANLRGAVGDARADYMPVFLSDIAPMFRSGVIRLDAAILHLSPPDKHGLCTLGTSVDVARAAADSAPMVIAEINRRAPRTHGAAAVPFSALHTCFYSDRPLLAHEPEPESPVNARIGEIVAGLIEDGSCLQVGIGGIPDAVLARLGDKRDLGVHTEMFSDRMADLVEGGVVTNRFKSVHPGRLTTSFVAGTQRIFDFVDDNPLVEFHGADRTNDTALIRKNERVVAVNSAIEVDLTGQVCADSIGHRIFSGIGGQMDFIRGAALSPGGKPIIALPATAAGGKLSRITAQLQDGAGVVTTRGHVHWIVTEYGAANLHGKTLRERGEALIALAHPDFRAELRKKLAAIRHFDLAG